MLLTTHGCENCPPTMRSILDYSPLEFAKALTMRMHYLYCCIPLSEFVVDTGFTKMDDDSDSIEEGNVRKHSKTPYLDRFRYESERLQQLLISEILV